MSIDPPAQEPILILGGGIGGLTTALALHRRGISCEVHERAPALEEIGAGLGLWPHALRVFDELGMGDDVRRLSGRWEVGGLRRADGRFLLEYRADQLAERLGEPTIGVHRGEFQALLVRSLPDGILHLDHECASVEDDGSGTVRVHFADGTMRAVSAVIAADGRRSRVRAQIFGTGDLHDCHAVGWRGTAAEPAGAGWRRVAGESWGGDVRFGMLPISNGRIAWYAGARSFLDRGSKAELRHRFAHLHDPIPALIEATPDDAIWRDSIDDLHPFRRWHRGRVALLGDAAHPMAPDLGQGACHAILDARAIASALATHPDPTVAFAHYQRARRRSAAVMVLVARAASAGGGADGRVSNAIAEALMARIPRGVALRGLSALVAS